MSVSAWRNLSVRVLCIFAACALTFPFAGVLSEILHIDHLSPNVRANFFSPSKATQSQDITIVGIRDRDLKGLPYISPVDRAYLGNLISGIAAYRPRVIVVDFLFDHPTEPHKEEALKALLKGLDVPVVLAYGDARAALLDPEYQKEFLTATGRPYGYSTLLKSADDDKSSFVVSHIPGSIDGTCSLAQLAYEPDCKKGDKTERAIDWLRVPEDGKPIFTLKSPRDLVPLSPQDVAALRKIDCDADPMARMRQARKSVADIRAAATAAVLNCRIVLLGGAFSFQDIHSTPMVRVVDGNFDKPHTSALPLTNDMYGIEIQATAIQQLIDKRALDDFPLPVVIAMVIAAAMVGGCLTLIPIVSRRAHVVLFLGAGLLMVVDVLLYVYAEKLFPGVKVAFAFGLAMLLTHYILRVKAFRLENAAEVVMEIIK